MSDNDPLAELNEHFARFLQHADGLLREWKSAIDEQTKHLQGRVQREVDAHLDQSVRDSLAQLRVEIDRLAARRPGAPAAAVPQPEARRSSPILAALISANVLLLVLVGLQIRSCADDRAVPAPAAAPPAAIDAGARAAPPPPPDAAPVPDAAPPDAAPPEPKKQQRRKRRKRKKANK